MVWATVPRHMRHQVSRQLRRLARATLTDSQRTRIFLRVKRTESLLTRTYLRLLRHDLDALARGYGTDKSSLGNGFATIYQQHFSEIRHSARSVLEIGVGGDTSQSGYETLAGGQSLRMWAAYFPNAHVVGIDLYPKRIRGRRISVEQGDQADPAFLAKIIARYGPFDVIVDDGSHIGRDVTASYTGLWGAVTSGGYYVIEDLGTAYHAAWEGGPPGTSGTAVAMLKDLLDDTVDRFTPPFVPSIASMHVQGSLAILRKR